MDLLEMFGLVGTDRARNDTERRALMIMRSLSPRAQEVVIVILEALVAVQGFQG